MSIIEIFKRVKHELADGLRGILWDQHSFGFEIIWENNIIPGNNILFINNSDGISYAENWIQENKTGLIWTLPNFPDLSNFFAKNEEFSFFIRPEIKLSYPNMSNYNFSTLSLNVRDLTINFQEISEKISELYDLTEPAKTEMNRYVGGILHMVDGEIWNLSDLEGNIISSAVTSTSESKCKFIECLATRSNFRNKGFAKTLIEYIIASNRKNSIAILLPKQYFLNSALKALKFEERITIQTWGLR